MPDPNYKVGETTWDEADVPTQGKFEKTAPLPILKMEYNKSYTIRIISKPYRYYAKWVVASTGKKVKILSSLTPDCPLCTDNVQPKLGRYIKVIYRPENGKPEFRVLDCGSQIYSGVKKIQGISAFGKDVSKYDIVLSKGSKGQNPLYGVNALPPSAMTEEDIAIARKYNARTIDDKENPDFIDLEVKCKPLPVEVIRKILEKIGSKGPTIETAEAGVFGEGEGDDPAPAPAAKPAPVAAAAKPAPAPAPKVAEAAAETSTPKPAAKPAAKAGGKAEDFLDF